MIERLIQELRNGIDGEVSDKTRVVDSLLDLRLAGSQNVAVIAQVDRLLAEVPGRTTVANGWWHSALDQVERACETATVG